MALLACGGGQSAGNDAGAPSTILGTPVSADATQPWDGTSPFEVISQNGDLTIIGDSTDGKVHITGTPFVVAVAGDANVALALADVTSGITGGRWGCSYASRAYGDIARTSTGCKNVVVHLPPGSASTPLRLTAHAYNGPLTLENLNLFDPACTGCPPNIQSNVLADDGSLTATGITGSIYAVAKAGNVTMGVTPNPAQQVPNPMDPQSPILRQTLIDIEATKGDVALSLPNAFVTDMLTLTATGTCTVSGFSPDVTCSTLYRGASGTGAKSIIANADDGNLTVTAM